MGISIDINVVVPILSEFEATMNRDIPIVDVFNDNRLGFGDDVSGENGRQAHERGGSKGDHASKKIRSCHSHTPRYEILCGSSDFNFCESSFFAGFPPFEALLLHKSCGKSRAADATRESPGLYVSISIGEFDSAASLASGAEHQPPMSATATFIVFLAVSYNGQIGRNLRIRLTGTTDGAILNSLIAGLGLYTHDHACARVDVHPKHLAAPLAFINEDATMTVEGSYGVETANLNDPPPSPAADAASDPGGFGIGVLAELKLKVGTRVDPVRLGERTPEQQWRQ
jgi:hypothetical protein